ncbi:MAG: DVUA0089 family protein [Spirochaetota bacterium]
MNKVGRVPALTVALMSIAILTNCASLIEFQGPEGPSLRGLNRTTELGEISGRTTAYGEAWRRHSAFTFTVDGPSTAEIEVVVTRIMEGMEYEDDDSVLYLFAEDGTLLGQDDDSGEGQASFLTVGLPEAGRYFVAVATYGDHVRLDSSNRLTHFSGGGMSRFEFDLVIDVY